MPVLGALIGVPVNLAPGITSVHRKAGVQGGVFPHHLSKPDRTGSSRDKTFFQLHTRFLSEILLGANFDQRSKNFPSHQIYWESMSNSPTDTVE